jgi:hypothetical protein
MEGSCSTGQSPQWAVVPVEEEEEPLHASGVFMAHHQEVNRIYIYTQQLVLIVLFSCLSVVLVGLMMGYKYARNMWRLIDENRLRINSASSWFTLHENVEMHGQQNIKNRM